MPQKKRPITHRPKVEDESTGNPPEKHGKHQPGDEALPGSGGSKGGLNRYSGVGRRGSSGAKHRRANRVTVETKQNQGKPKGPKQGRSNKRSKPTRHRGPTRKADKGKRFRGE